ncbi:glycosyltransferase family 2 protein [Planctomycetota bacterium]
MKFSVIVPAYNEEKTVGEMLARLVKLNFIDEIIFVDDGSSDSTLDEAHKAAKKGVKAKKKLHVVSLPENSGKGHAVRKGIQKTTGDIVAICDADFEYDPQEYKEMLALFKDNQAEAVYGTRFSGAKPHRVQGFIHYLGNRMVTLWTNLFFNIHLTDMETCFKMVKGDLLRSLKLSAESFDIEVEITTKLAKKHIRIYEVPISYHGRGYDEGKKLHWYHGLQALWAIVKYRFMD